MMACLHIQWWIYSDRKRNMDKTSLDVCSWHEHILPTLATSIHDWNNAACQMTDDFINCSQQIIIVFLLEIFIIKLFVTQILNE